MCAVGKTASAISQYAQYGDVNWLQASVDGLFAVASTALAYTGIGLIGSIAAVAGMDLAQYTLDSAIFHDDFSWFGALIATGLGALGGLASGRGAQHFKSIGSNLDDTGRTGVNASEILEKILEGNNSKQKEKSELSSLLQLKKKLKDLDIESIEELIKLL